MQRSYRGFEPDTDAPGGYQAVTFAIAVFFEE